MLMQSDHVKFRPLEPDDAAVFLRWSEDRQVTQYSLSQYVWPQALSDIRSWLASIHQGTTSFTVGVCCHKTGKLIGYAGISRMNQINRSGEFFILIGEPHYWGRGIGTDVTQVISDYGFTSLNLHRIELTAYVTNLAAIRAYEKAGYHHEGILRDAGFRNGQYLDKVVMAVLATDWQGIR
ncbi:GNAT family N-acetyltransferase [Celerinatantimonas yamalensis]|uniref:GNAT family protein n=1 Tax=Celerinatantimonas yamalensis TaxID=559956 RepID=A0ABW9G324_9GAMM